MLLAIKALIVPNARKVGKDFIVVAVDMVKAVRGKKISGGRGGKGNYGGKDGGSRGGGQKGG